MITQTDCRVMRRMIDEAESGESLSRQVAEHIAVCDSCREFRNQRARLRELVGGLKPVEAPPDFDMRLRARLVSERAGAAWFSLPALSFGRPAFVACAAVVILLGAVVLVNRTGFSWRSSDRAKAISTSGPKQVAEAPKETSRQSVVPEKELAASISQPSKAPASRPRRLIPERNRPVNLAVKTGSGMSKDFALGPAPVYRQDQLEPNAAEISLSKPFEFSLQDSRGVTHRISLPPVSFGSQQLIQNGQRIQPTSYAASRVW